MKEKRKEKDFISDKHKKKKKKHKKKYNSSSSGDSDSGEDMQWVEASSIHNTSPKLKKSKKKHKKKYDKSSSSESEYSDTNCSKADSYTADLDQKQRDSWMSEETFVPTLSKSELLHSSTRQRKLDSKRELQEKEQKIQRERELNPHWNNDGTGLPEKEANVESLSLPSTSVGDGGYSWLKKAYYRIQEQAQQEGRSMEEVAVERWGSLSKLTSLIEEAESRMMSHPDWKKSHNRHSDKYDRNNRDSRAKFRKPSEGSSDSPFEFRRPTNDSKNRKVLNQFKSSRKSNPLWYSELDDRTENKKSDLRNDSVTESSMKYERQNYETEKTDSRNYTPAWKKPRKPAERKDEPKNSSPEISCTAKDVSEVPVICSEEDLSKLAARQIKAEIMGDAALAQKLKEQLEEARKTVKEKGFAKQPSKKTVEVILSKIDAHGQERPLQTTQDKISDYKEKKRNKYFDDESKYSLKEMFEREKLTTADDHMEVFVEASSQCNETDELDYESGKISKKLSQKLASGRQDEKDIGKAMNQHQKRMASLEKCAYCLDQPHMRKHLLIDVGDEVYLCLPNYQTMTEGHCLIVPKSHVPSFLSLDENEWREVNDLKNQLRSFFRSVNKSVIFLETSMNFRYFPHAVLECIPVPEEDGDMAPFYFKKAIQESEAEWAHNKKLVDLTNKGLRHSVPKNLPYFHVEFDPRVHAGYAHVIEDERQFPHNFGKEVVGGMLDIDYNYLYKNKKGDSLKKSKEVVDFEKKWKKFKDSAS